MYDNFTNDKTHLSLGKTIIYLMKFEGEDCVNADDIDRFLFQIRKNVNNPKFAEAVKILKSRPFVQKHPYAIVPMQDRGLGHYLDGSVMFNCLGDGEGFLPVGMRDGKEILEVSINCPEGVDRKIYFKHLMMSKRVVVASEIEEMMLDAYNKISQNEKTL